MIYYIGDNITSPIGNTAVENYRNVLEGRSGLSHYDPCDGLQEEHFVSKMDHDLLAERFADLQGVSCGSEKSSNQNASSQSLSEHFPASIGASGTGPYTPLEQAAILSATDALSQAGIDAASPDTLFILSTTKGNVHLLDSKYKGQYVPERLCLWSSAQMIAQHFGNRNTPVVVSNACISGACAQIAAKRALESGRYRYAVVIGADMLSPFIISGFQSFKALSPELCRPFDAQRRGLNLGEAAATIVYCREDAPQAAGSHIVLEEGAIRNDANHISGPSRTGEGSYLALKEITEGIDLSGIAFVNTHGTSTMYNDEMESIALTRAGLADTPVDSLKGYFGHTLGAAGVLETIISSHAIRGGIVLKTRGFETLGVTNPLKVASENMKVGGDRFIKMLSGFGGCNAALLLKKR